jgi:hypothetical protein
LERIVVEDRLRSEEEKKTDRDRTFMDHRNAEIQANLEAAKRKTEAEAAELRATAERIKAQMKRAEESRARLVVEMEGAREKALLERAELERKSFEERQKYQQQIDELRQVVEGMKNSDRDHHRMRESF